MKDGHVVLPGRLPAAELPAVRAAAQALDAAPEDPSGSAVAPVLPRHDGPRADLPLNRTPPAWRVAA
jgi:hypothetical protein